MASSSNLPPSARSGPGSPIFPGPEPDQLIDNSTTKPSVKSARKLRAEKRARRKSRQNTPNENRGTVIGRPLKPQYAPPEKHVQEGPTRCTTKSKTDKHDLHPRRAQSTRMHDSGQVIDGGSKIPSKLHTNSNGHVSAPVLRSREGLVAPPSSLRPSTHTAITTRKRSNCRPTCRYTSWILVTILCFMSIFGPRYLHERADALATRQTNDPDLPILPAPLFFTPFLREVERADIARQVCQHEKVECYQEANNYTKMLAVQANQTQRMVDTFREIFDVHIPTSVVTNECRSLAEALTGCKQQVLESIVHLRDVSTPSRMALFDALQDLVRGLWQAHGNGLDTAAQRPEAYQLMADNDKIKQQRVWAEHIRAITHVARQFNRPNWETFAHKLDALVVVLDHSIQHLGCSPRLDRKAAHASEFPVCACQPSRVLDIARELREVVGHVPVSPAKSSSLP